MRQSRKSEHIKYSLELADGPLSNGFEDIHLIHNCLSDMAFEDIDVSSAIAGISLKTPLLINAITGGAEDVLRINAELSQLAARTHLAMAVGSQYAALENSAAKASYQVVRTYNPHGVILANLGAHASPEQAQKAIDMIEANALQLHLNVAQEIIMPEGDRDFSCYLKNIEAIVRAVNVPVIVKEVGCGIAKEQAKALLEIGVQCLDTGGMGGTNFIAIESARNVSPVRAEMLEWGIPTAISAFEAAFVLTERSSLVVSGGIRTPIEAVKGLAIGASAVGMAGSVLKHLQSMGLEKTCAWLEDFLIDIKRLMLLTGSKTLSELHQVPLVITGQTREWLNERGIDTKIYAQREKHG